MNGTSYHEDIELLKRVRASLHDKGFLSEDITASDVWSELVREHPHIAHLRGGGYKVAELVFEALCKLEG